MKTRLRFITPCFAAGADQRVAEIRPSAIRGELRWWFRCLGGSKTQEDAIFGAMAGSGSSSSVLVRISDIQRSEKIHSPSFISPNDPAAYHHYLLTAPNDKGCSRMWSVAPDPVAKKKGVVRAESQIPPDSTFLLTALLTRCITDEVARGIYDLALASFLAFGSIGYRKSRGFGAWVSDEGLGTRTDVENLLKRITEKGFSWSLNQGGSNDALAVLRQVESRLKGDKKAGTGLRLNHKAEQKTPLGYSHERDRQSSAVYFRPCAFKTKAGNVQYSLLLFQAPDKVLGNAVLTNYRGKTRLI